MVCAIAHTLLPQNVSLDAAELEHPLCGYITFVYYYQVSTLHACNRQQQCTCTCKLVMMTESLVDQIFTKHS